jgi:hypothetical protein
MVKQDAANAFVFHTNRVSFAQSRDRTLTNIRQMAYWRGNYI